MKKPKINKTEAVAIIIYIIAFIFAIIIMFSLCGFIDAPKLLPAGFHRDNKSANSTWEREDNMKYSDITILGNDLHRITIYASEYELMCNVVMAEAEGEPYEAQEAVAQTILNRWLCEDKFPDSITGVIQDPGQFTTTTKEPSVSCCLAVRNAVEFYNTFAMNYPKTMYYFRDSEYHRFGIPHTQIGNLYFSLAETATD